MASPKIGRHLTRLILNPALFVVYSFFRFFPRNKRIWVFGIPKKFTWSSKYLFLYLVNRKEKGIQPVWIARDRKLIQELRSLGYPAYFWFSFAGIWFCLRAGFYIVDASLDTINFWLSAGAKELMMWHGIPLKKIEKDIKKGDSIDAKVQQSRGITRFFIRMALPWAFRKPDYLIATSPIFQNILAGAFRVDKERVCITGFPKNDVYAGDIRGADIGTDRAVLAKLKDLKGAGSLTKTILYAPTWRDTGGDSFFERPDDLALLDEFLAREHLFFFLKLHPLAQAKMFVSLHENQYRNIFFVSPDSDADPLLPLIDVLVTDYSGIYFEFLLLDRPMVFFPFDYEKYVTRDRELYFDYGEVTPGPKVKTLEELVSAIKDIVQGKDEYKGQRKQVCNLAHTYQDGKSASRVCELLREISRIHS